MSGEVYLSRLTLNPRNQEVRRDAALPYELHRTLLQAFPAGGVGVERSEAEALGVLFRLEEPSGNQAPVVLVQSKAAPNWRFLLDKTDGRGHPYLLPVSQTPDERPNPEVIRSSLDWKPAAGAVLAFRLRANPTVKKDRPGERQGRRVGLYTEAEQLEWLRRKAAAAGFRILEVQVRKDGNLKDERNRLELVSVQFDGVLEVVDPERLFEAIVNGIGSGKGFGFGLLSLDRIRG